MTVLGNEDRLRYSVPFFQVSNGLIDMCVRGELELSIFARMAYLALCRYGNRDGTAFPSYKKMSLACGMSERKVQDAINELVEVGLVEKKKQYLEKKDGSRGRQISNFYIINIPDNIVGVAGDATHEGEMVAQDATPRVAQDAGGGWHGVPTIKKYNNKEITTNIYSDGVCFDDNEKLKDVRDEVVKKIVGLYNSMMDEKDFDRADFAELPEVVRDNTYRRYKDNAGNMSAFRTVFEKASKNTFLIAGSETWFGGADFDWFMVEKNFKNVIRGKYAPNVDKVCINDNKKKDVDIKALETREYLDDMERRKLNGEFNRDENKHREFMQDLYRKIGSKAIPV
jgi:hypothetical protein